MKTISGWLKMWRQIWWHSISHKQLSLLLLIATELTVSLTIVSIEVSISKFVIWVLRVVEALTS